MLNETDLPCTDCGSALEERVVSLSELLQSTTNSERVTLAVCPRCGATYYPNNALSVLSQFQKSRSRGGS